MQQAESTITGPQVTAGRAVDIVHGAILAAGLQPYRITAEAHDEQSRTTDGVTAIGVQLTRTPSEDRARGVFAMLGCSTTATMGQPFGTATATVTAPALAHLTSFVPVLGMRVHILVTAS